MERMCFSKTLMLCTFFLEVIFSSDEVRLYTYQIGGDFEVSKGDGFVFGDTPAFEIGHSELVQGHDQLLARHRHGCSAVHTAHTPHGL